MVTGIDKMLEGAYEELAKAEEKVRELKKAINTFSGMAGKTPPFSEIEASPVYGNLSLRPDQFFGRGLSTAVKEFLRMKGRACTAQEILDALKEGGFEFPTDWKEKFMLKNLSISLGKNRYDFVPVPNPKGDGAYGLWEFYPEKKKERDKAQKAMNGNKPDDEKESVTTESKNNGQPVA